MEDIPFIVRSDHQALQRKLHKSIHDLPISARQARWIERLMPFSLDFQYISGKNNVVADALSRHPHLHLNTVTTISAHLAGLIQRMALAAQQDEQYQTVIRHVQSAGGMDYHVEGGLLTSSRGTIWVPQNETLRTLLISEAHDPRISGHFGVVRTYEKLQRHWEWPGMREDVKEYVRTCVRCQLTKIDSQKPKGLLIPIPSPAPWHTITLDFVGKFTPSASSGKTHCLVIVDKFSKYVLLEPVHETITAKDTADILIKRVISEHGVPARVISDRGPQFTSEVWKKVLEGFGSNIALAATHHPQSDGQSERAIRTLIQLLRAFTNQQQDAWEEVLPLLQFALNDAHCEATSSTPFRILLGRDPRTPLDFAAPSETDPSEGDNREPDARLKQQLDSVNEFIQERQQEVMARMKTQADKHRRNYKFEPGDQVLLSTKSHPALMGNRKQAGSPGRTFCR